MIAIVTHLLDLGMKKLNHSKGLSIDKLPQN